MKFIYGKKKGNDDDIADDSTRLKTTKADQIINPLVLIVVVITYIQILATSSTRMRLKLQHQFSPIKNELSVM